MWLWNRLLRPCIIYWCTCNWWVSSKTRKWLHYESSFDIWVSFLLPFLNTLEKKNTKFAVVQVPDFGINFSFRCGYDQQNPGPHPPPPTAGILGLGRGKVGISTQLKSLGITKNVIVHCLSHTGKGFLSIGDELVPSSGVTWTSLATNSARWAIFEHYILYSCHLFTHTFIVARNWNSWCDFFL